MEFNTTRWAVYLMVGPIALAVYFLIPTRYQKFLILLAALIFLEGVLLSWRPFFFVGFSLSSAVSYVFLAALLFSEDARQRMPAMTGAWFVLLSSALIGAFIGALTPGVGFAENIILFQMFFAEALIYFWIGRSALRNADETYRVLVWLVLFGGVVGVLHLISLTTGYRFYTGGQRLVGASSEVFFRYGAVFINPNTLADFYAMVLPVGVVLRLGWIRPGRFVSAAVLASMVIMGVSLLLTASRGGLAAAVMTCGIAVLLLPMGLRRAGTLIGTAVTGASLVLVALYVLFPDFLDKALERFTSMGLESIRYSLWSASLEILTRNPLGVGLHTRGFFEAVRPFHIYLASPHNIYLGIAVSIGIPGLISFLVIVGGCFRRILHARRLGEATLRTVSTAICLLLLGFLIGGITEPIYRNGFKLQHLFWLFAGMGSVLPLLPGVGSTSSESGSQATASDPIPGVGVSPLQLQRIDSP